MSEYKKIRLNTARNCLRYIVKAFNIKEIYLPYYICPQLRLALKHEGIKINYYHIDLNFRPIENFPSDAFILYPDYFGICSSVLREMSDKYENLIADYAHSFYSKPIGIASFNSLRKYFPELRDGAILCTKKSADFKPKKDNYSYIITDLTEEIFLKNEERLNNSDILLMSDTTEKYFRSVNIEEEKLKRIQKFNYYHSILGEKNLLKIENNTLCYKYPYLAKTEQEADNLVIKLKKQGINIFRYWNNLPQSFPEKIFHSNLAAIPLV